MTYAREAVEQATQSVHSSAERMVEISARHRPQLNADDLMTLKASAYTLLALVDHIEKAEAAE